MNSINDPLFLGLDAGGTQTRAVLVRGDGTVVGIGRSGASNWNNVGIEAAVAALRAAAAAAWSAAGGEFRPAQVAFVSSAGVKAEADRLRIANAAANAGLAGPSRCVAANDTEAALAGGLPGRPGIVLIAGTGSFCLGRDENRRVAHCGGWGWAIDDVGSGFFLGREALRAAAFAADGRGRPTQLTRIVLEQLGAREPDEILGQLYAPAFTAGKVADLAPHVIACARNGDEVALGILDAGARGLSELVRRVATDLALNVPELVLVGGVARSGAPYQPMLENALRAALPALRIVEPELPPMAGAALRALEIGGVMIEPGIVQRMRAGISTGPSSHA